MRNQSSSNQPSTPQARITLALRQMAYLVTSRRRQSEIITLEWVFIIIGTASAAAALFSATSDDARRVLGGISILAAGWIGYQVWARRQGSSRLAAVVMVGLAILAAETVALLTAIDVVVLWGMTLVIVALLTLVLRRQA